jgi:hypothetical protein
MLVSVPTSKFLNIAMRTLLMKIKIKIHGSGCAPNAWWSFLLIIMGVRLTSHWTAAAFVGLLFVPGWMNEWMNCFFLIFGNVDPTLKWYRQGKTEKLRKNYPSATLSTTNPTGLTWERTRTAAVRGRRLTVWAMARPIMIIQTFITTGKMVQKFLEGSTQKAGYGK